jgi:hypothetical protein
MRVALLGLGEAAARGSGSVVSRGWPVSGVDPAACGALGDSPALKRVTATEHRAADWQRDRQGPSAIAPAAGRGDC